MSHRVGRALAAAALIAITAGGAALPASAQTSTPGACGDSTGVTVVVDFQAHLGPGIRVGCAEQPVTSGLDALAKAGFVVTQSQRSPGFVCRIDDQPATDPCIADSPITAYWSYWYGPPAGSWTYSSLGAGNRTPPPGSVEGWSFAYSPTGAAAPRPGIPPPAPATMVPTDAAPPVSVATAPPTSAPGSPTAGPAQGVTGGSSPAVGRRPATPVVVGPESPTTTSSAAAGPGASPSSTSAAAATAGPTTSTTSGPAVQVESAHASRAGPTRRSSSSSGTAIGTIVAVIAIVVAGAGAGIASRRRARVV